MAMSFIFPGHQISWDAPPSLPNKIANRPLRFASGRGVPLCEEVESTRTPRSRRAGRADERFSGARQAETPIQPKPAALSD